MEYVERNKERGFGQPVILGTGITVLNAVFKAYYSESISSFLEEYDLTFAQLKSATDYCRARKCKENISESDHFCRGCILRSVSEGWHSFRDDFVEIDSVSISKDGKSFLLTGVEDADNDEFGYMGWIIAQELEKKLSS